MSKIRLKKIEQGTCPYCESWSIDYEPPQFEDDMVNYMAKCRVCGNVFQEWYKMNFIGHNVGSDLDICTDVGDEGIEIEM